MRAIGSRQVTILGDPPDRHGLINMGITNSSLPSAKCSNPWARVSRNFFHHSFSHCNFGAALPLGLRDGGGWGIDASVFLLTVGHRKSIPLLQLVEGDRRGAAPFGFKGAGFSSVYVF